MISDYVETDYTKIDTLTEFQTWRPNPRQQDALQVPYDFFELLYGGALGGGKSEYLLSIPIVCQTKISKKQLYEHPLFRGIIFRRTFPQLEKSLIPRAKAWYKHILGADYNETKKSFTFPSGAIVYLAHMERDEDVLGHDTNEYHYVGIDQAEQFSEYQIRMISSRIRSSIPDLPVILRMGANPGGISHTFLRDRFVKPEPNGNVRIYDAETKSSRIFIPAKLEDNPHIYQTDPDYVNRLNLLPESERAAKISGDWFSFSGQVFTEFRPKKIPSEPANALHVISPFVIPDWWPRILSIDWGFTAKTFAIWSAISPDERVFIYREYGVNKTNISTWASDISRLSQYEKLSSVILDPSAWQNRGDILNIAQQFTKWSGLHAFKADNDRLGGKQLIHDLLRWKPKPVKYQPPEGFNIERAQVIMRIHGVEAYKNYCNSFAPEEPETNLPRMQIFNTCPEVIDAIQQCQYDDKNKDKKSKVEDVREFVGDDAYDCLRYNVKRCDHFLTELKKTDKNHKLHNEIMQEFESTKDFNILEFRMRHLEKMKLAEEVKPVMLH